MSEIEAVKRLIPISSLINSDKNRIKCPIPGHDDKHPSCDVDHDLGFWHCKSCDKGGDIFELLMVRDRLTFHEALVQLAAQAGVPLGKKDNAAQLEWDKTQRINAALAYAANYYNQNLLTSTGGKLWLQSRGLTEESAKALRLGLADGYLGRSIKAATNISFSVADCVDAGLLINDRHNPNTHRDFFQNRIIFPLLKKGRVLNLSGRAMLSDDKPKYLHLAKLPTEHFYNEDAIGKKVWLFEGHPDTAVAYQTGLPAVGVIGTSGMTQPKRLKAADTIYICGDSDNAGQSATDRWASQILHENPTCKVLFISLPDGIKDFNEWYLRNMGAGYTAAFNALEKTAKGFIEFRISKLQTTADLLTIWPLLEPLAEINRSHWFDGIKKQLQGVSIASIRKAFSTWSKERLAAIAQMKAITEDVSFKRSAVSRRANIDFKGNRANVCLWAEVKRQRDGTVTKDYEAVVLQTTINDDGGYSVETITTEEGCGFQKGTIPLASLVEGRWRDDAIQKFISHEQEPVNTMALVQDLAGYFRRFIWHRDPVTHDILALFAMGTYCARIFGAFPYLALNGLAGSGKSNTLDLLQQVCFNAIHTANITPASLFRSIEMSFPTCIRDEAEQFNKKTPENMDELTMLNAGYKAGAKVIRTEKNAAGQMQPEEFDLFSPKIFAGINMLNDTLVTRAILVKMHKAPKDIVKGMPKMVQTRAKWENQGADLRDRLYAWVMTKHHLIRQVFSDFTPIDEIANRDWEVWLPLLSIAYLADTENDQRQPDEELLTQRLVAAAIKKSKERRDMAQDNAVEQKVLETIIVLMDDLNIHWVNGEVSWYAIHEVSAGVSKSLIEEGFFSEKKAMNPRWLMRILDQTQVIDRETQTKFIKEGGKSKRCVHLPKASIETALSNM